MYTANISSESSISSLGATDLLSDTLERCRKRNDNGHLIKDDPDLLLFITGRSNHGMSARSKNDRLTAIHFDVSRKMKNDNAHMAANISTAITVMKVHNDMFLRHAMI